MKKRAKKRATGSKRTRPITREQVDYVLQEFHDRNDTRMEIVIHLLFRVIRIGDVLRTLKKHHIYDAKNRIRDTLEFVEEKTGKKRSLPLKGESFVRALMDYTPQISSLDANDPLFFGKIGTPLTDSGVKFLLSQFVGKRGIEQLSPHSLRKAGSRYMYENGARIESISAVLNQHSSRTTERYICITPKDIEESMKCLEI